MSGEGDPLLLLTPLLTSSNVHVVAKVASKIPCEVHITYAPLEVYVYRVAYQVPK